MEELQTKKFCFYQISDTAILTNAFTNDYIMCIVYCVDVEGKMKLSFRFFDRIIQIFFS